MAGFSHARYVGSEPRLFVGITNRRARSETGGNGHGVHRGDEDGEVTRRLIEIPSYSRLALEFIGHARCASPRKDPNHECRMRPLLHRRITIRPCPLMGWSGRAQAPPAGEAGKGRQRRGAGHVTQAAGRHRGPPSYRRSARASVSVARDVVTHPLGKHPLGLVAPFCLDALRVNRRTRATEMRTAPVLRSFHSRRRSYWPSSQ